MKDYINHMITNYNATPSEIIIGDIGWRK